MHIKEIIIDGFKSYSIKTSIKGLDRHFNAITGLNGSGKSNIFDAICFLLGITSLTHVRATNLQDLIYNKGNTGVTKASVTIIFDNTDKEGSPISFKEYDEITVSRTIYQGKSKYYLNGYTSSQEQIKNLFQSVQLNINNPHFLILQGKIRQVVNMKPIEILGLLEEAAGTSVFELRKEAAIKLLRKKENKIEEMVKLQNEVITPQLTKLFEDKKNFLEWKNRENEINKISKILIANDYYLCSKNSISKSSELVQYKSQQETSQETINNLHIKIEEVEEKIKEEEGKFKINNDNLIKELEKKCKDFKTLIKTNNHKIEQFENSLKKCEVEISKINDIKLKINNEIESFENDKKNLISNQEMYEKDENLKKGYLKELETNLENFKCGKSDNVSLFNYNKLMNDTNNNKNKAAMEKKNLVSQMQIMNDDNKNKKIKLNEYNQKLKTSENKFKEYENKIQKLEKEYQELTKNKNSNNLRQSIVKQISDLQGEINSLERYQNEILNKFGSRIEVSFRDPQLNFDRSKVKGRIIRMFTLDNDKYARAIEAAAGAKLYNIVVDNEATASLLFQRKSFDYGVILIPNNKIIPKSIPHDKLRLIEQVAGSEATLALNLIKFDNQFKPAMEYVFGNVVICNTTEIAKKLTYTPSIRVKCVNLDGDVFDPSGTMTGGARRNNESILKKVVELSNVQNKIHVNKGKIAELNKDISQMDMNQKRIFELENDIQSNKNEQTEFDKNKIGLKIKEIENEIEKNNDNLNRIENRIEELNGIEKKYAEDLKKLQEEKNEFNNVSSSTQRKNIYEKKISSVKKLLSDYQTKIKETKDNINTLEYKISENQRELKNTDVQIKTEMENIDSFKSDISSLKNENSKNNDNLNKTEAELYEKKEEMMKNEQKVNELKNEKKNLENNKDRAIQDLKKLENRIIKYEKEIKECEENMKRLNDENKWIQTEFAFFGMKDTEYDFSNLDQTKELKKLTELKEKNAILKRKVNMKVDVMVDEYEKQYNDLIKKKDTLVKNKLNLQKAIDDLDRQRRDSLQVIYDQVNESINSIYSTLLPNTKARLSQVDDKDLMNGLELKVAFNNQWKKSLAELSGGQVSLLALSLILALLLYKPAPIYIFDEIDAALDLSHTANLGLMIKEHFPQSQFIVISLKDGMFNNANVLYRVSYVGGTSKVERMTKSSI